MYDKQVRRRRAVLLGLVLCCLVLLTAYFGESSGGPLRSVQTGAMEVVAPVQEGANRALKPFRDLFGWFGDTIDAKGERDKLEAERDQLRQQLARLQMYENENRELRDLVEYVPRRRAASSTSRSPRASTAARTRRGTRRSRSTRAPATASQVNQPVINGKGLVGKVKTVSDGNAVVMLLSDSDFGVSARRRAGEPARLDPAGRGLAGRPAARPRARGQARCGPATWSSPPARSPSACPRRSRRGHPDRPRQAHRGRGRAGPHDPRRARRRPAQPRLRPGAHPAGRRPARLHRDAVTWSAAAVARLVAHRPRRRHPAADHGLAGGVLRRPRRPVAAARRRDRPALRLDRRRELRLRPRPVHRHACWPRRWA